MNSLQIFKNDLFGNMKAMMIEDEPWFLGKDVATALGYAIPQKAVKDHVDKEDLKTLKYKAFSNSERPNLWGENDYSDKILINESGLYDLIFSSDLDSAKAFRKWVTSEVLPTLRRSGCYIGEAATQETIDYQAKFSVRRIRKTFKEAANPRALYEEFYELSKEECRVHHINNKDRISASKLIIKELQCKIDNGDVTMRASEKMALQELISDIQYDITKLANKANGGIKSGQTKQINKLAQENVLLKEENNQWQTYVDELEEYYNPTRVWTTVDYHGFTYNKAFENGHKTPLYNWWIKNFPVNQVPTKEEYELYQGIDFTKPIGIDLHFVKMAKYDTDNLMKSAIDMIFNRILKVDDNIVVKPVPMTVGTCDSTDEGKIIFAIYNVDIDEEW
jgi:prophage antirepressor-like protein